ncbi:MAG: DegT/DnrJ/EryC1/StrS aminotransferase family protein, partial [Deltaproteobacteria bacterium]|nr:DegT/DnrJ/EryC1/StrS aminotransferase family protein [Deltaproteobacteria bacterium]
MRTQFLPFATPCIGEEEINEVTETLRSGWLTAGHRVERFEWDFQDFIGCKHALAVSSGTAALHLSLQVLQIGAGDEVITTP